MGSGTKSLNSRVAQGEFVEILTSPLLSALLLEFYSVSERVILLQLQSIGVKVLSNVCVYTTQQLGLPAFLESLGGVLEGMPPGGQTSVGAEGQCLS